MTLRPVLAAVDMIIARVTSATDPSNRMNLLLFPASCESTITRWDSAGDIVRVEPGGSWLTGYLKIIFHLYRRLRNRLIPAGRQGYVSIRAPSSRWPHVRSQRKASGSLLRTGMNAAVAVPRDMRRTASVHWARKII